MEKGKRVFDIHAITEDLIKNGPTVIEEYEYDENGKLKSRILKINPNHPRYKKLEI